MPSLEAHAEKTAEPASALSALSEIESAWNSPAPNPEIAHDLLTVLGNSPFLRRWALRHPMEIAAMLARDYHFPKKLAEFERDYRKRASPAEPQNSEELARRLVAFKYEELFRISLLDLNQRESLEVVLEQLSALAACIVRVALAFFASEARSEIAIPYTVLAMGKLGGNELNFSSDLDLIYLHGNDEGRNSKKSSGISPHEHFVRLSQALTNFLNKKTPDGFLYRIDLDLRPEGKAGALVTSLDAIEQYYEFFGAPWEKQALIKVGLAAGDPALLKQFLRRIEPFVYSKTSDFSLLVNLKEMKAKIVASLKSQEKNALHLKLGDGGIREIEFFVQSLQLLFGGLKPHLRTSNTLLTIRELEKAGLINGKEANDLSDAYRFLRKMEHRLQLVEEQQTHLLPIDPEEREQLARRMGYEQPSLSEAAGAMMRDLEKHRDFVKATFQELLSHRFED